MKKGDLVLVTDDPSIGWMVRKFTKEQNNTFIVETLNNNCFSSWKYCVKFDTEIFNNKLIFPNRENGV